MCADGFANAKILILKQITTKPRLTVFCISDGFANAKILILKQITTGEVEAQPIAKMVLLMQRY